MRDQFLAALRGLRHRPGVAATVVLTLTLGIGANSAICSAETRCCSRAPLHGIRMALGARLCLTRFVTALVFDTPPLDPPTSATVPALLAAVALTAALLPARRGAGVDPMRALRED